MSTLQDRSLGVGRVYQQTVIDTYAKVAFAKLNDRVVPFYDEHGIRLSRILTRVAEN